VTEFGADSPLSVSNSSGNGIRVRERERIECVCRGALIFECNCGSFATLWMANRHD